MEHNMNKRQMIILWVVVLLLSAIAFVQGDRERDRRFIRFGIPIILIGGTLIYQFRDKDQRNAPIRTKNILTILVVITLFQTVLLLAQTRELSRTYSKLDDAASSLDDIQSNTTEIESETSSIESDVSNR